MNEQQIPGVTNDDDPHIWLSKQLDAADVAGKTVTELATDLLPRVPFGHISHWTLPALTKACQDKMLDRGYIANIANRKTGSRAAPLQKPSLMDEPEMIAWLKTRKAADDASKLGARRRVEEWIAAHPDTTRTVTEMLKLAGWSEADAA